MAAATKKGGLGTQANIIQDLLWQRSVGGDTAKIAQWKEIMGNLQDFKAYLFVKQGSSFTMVMHSPIKFTAISVATGHLQGRIIGFVETGPQQGNPHQSCSPSARRGNG
jgi:hypothetical protein